MAIWDEDNNPVPVGEQGEIVAKTDGQMTGFWNNPEATAERIVNGWVKTGDIGRLDANGYLYMMDRSDDMTVPVLGSPVSDVRLWQRSLFAALVDPRLGFLLF